MAVEIRDYGGTDQDSVVELSLRAWRPVFESINGVLGPELATHLHGEDRRVYQARSVSETLGTTSNRSWVAEADGRIRGFVVTATADPDRLILAGVRRTARRASIHAVAPARRLECCGLARAVFAVTSAYRCGTGRQEKSHML
jgi:hypothetical protein